MRVGFELVLLRRWGSIVTRLLEDICSPKLDLGVLGHQKSYITVKGRSECCQPVGICVLAPAPLKVSQKAKIAQFGRSVVGQPRQALSKLVPLETFAILEEAAQGCPFCGGIFSFKQCDRMF